MGRMGLVSHLYLKLVACRYDKQAGIPYYSHKDFDGLRHEAYSFTNSFGTEIKYFYYYYDNPRQDRLILFCHGLGPGHTAYLAEIENFAKRGYKVLTLDFTGCGESGGKNMVSFNRPTSDVMELLDLLKPSVPVFVVGHSLGGYTALNIVHLREEIKKAVILAGFLTFPSAARGLLKNRFLVSRVLRYEKKIEPRYFDIGNIDYLKNTDDSIYVIQSEDDSMVPFDIGLKAVEGLNNPHLKTLHLEGHKHSPTYTIEAVQYMNEVFGKYNRLLKKKQLKTAEDKIHYFDDVSLAKLVEQDQDVAESIFEFLEN